MPLSIATSGKGGVGKTTISALLVRYFIEAGKGPVLAVDADPNTSLGPLLGMEPATAIGDLREQSKDPANIPQGVPKARALETWLNEIIEEGQGFDLLTMGRSEGPGCYCYVNNLLREFLRRLKKSYPVIIIDNEAGMEHLSRLTTDNIDCLMAVTEPTTPSVRTVRRILKLTENLPITIGRQALIFNKVLNGGIPGVVLNEAQELEISAKMELAHSQPLAEIQERGGSIFELPGKVRDNAQLVKIAKWCQQNKSN